MVPDHGVQMQPSESAQSPPGVGGARNMGMVLSVVAVVLALVAVGIAFAVPGPAGPQGATGANGTDGTNGTRGPTGATGPGALMSSFLGGIISMTTGCTNEVQRANLTVPSKGNVTVTASVLVEISHSNGGLDEVDVYVTLPPPDGNCFYLAGVAYVPSSAPTDLYEISVPVAMSWPVTAAGSYSYAIGGSQPAASATSNAAITRATGYGVFYPG